MEPTACDAAATDCSTPAVSERVVAPSTPAAAVLPSQGRGLAAEVRVLDGARWVKLPEVSWQDDPAKVEEHIKLTVSAVTADTFNKILLPADITAAEKLQTDEKEHLREMHNELQVRGWPLTSYAAHWALAEHRHVKKVISQLDTDGDGNLNAENLLQGAPEMHEDEREHLLESLQKREARGEKLTAHQAHLDLEQHREVRSIVHSLFNGLGTLTLETIEASLLQDDEKQHLQAMLMRHEAKGMPLTAYEAHEGLEEHREVSKFVDLLYASKGKNDSLTSADIESTSAADLPQDERAHLLEANRRFENQGRKMLRSDVHELLEDYRLLQKILGKFVNNDNSIDSNEKRRLILDHIREHKQASAQVKYAVAALKCARDSESAKRKRDSLQA